MDRLLRGMLEGGGARVVAAVTTDACREAARRHGAGPAAAVALARAQTAALLLATLTKGGERVTLQILGRGPLGTVTVDANDLGDVRGYVTGSGAVAEAIGGRLRLGPLVAPGIVSLIRDLGLKEPYRGSSTLVSGEIDEDIEAHLTTSEQVMSALGCDAVVPPEGAGALTAAGGLLVQCLPGGDLAAVEDARARLREDRLAAALAGGIDEPATLAHEVLGVTPHVLEVRPVRFRCRCSRERVASALHLCGAAELRDMLREQQRAEVTCNFCGTRYGVDAGELARLIAEVEGVAKA